MQKFDCLARELPLFGPHLLEASAGTGKTFSIEHIYVRLILESIEAEQILAVTFTRAATRELKARIRANLEKALAGILSKNSPWDYLQPHFGSDAAIRLLTDALASFDRCQIFTIHGFCYRMLREFAFEAKVGSFSLPDEGKKIPETVRLAALDFLENGIDASLLCPEHLSLLFKQFESMEEIADRLIHSKAAAPSLSFSEISTKCKAALHSLRDPQNSPGILGNCIAALHLAWGELNEAKLLSDFHALKKNYKATIKGDFEMQVKALADHKLFPALLKERGTLFDFLHPDNQKVRVEEPKSLHYPGFFDWARIHIAPVVKKKVFPILQESFQPIAAKVIAEEELFDPDEILLQMKRAMDQEHFLAHVRQKYAAAMIDEFQDTDAVQWEIFQKLFFEKPLRAVYLVGDPKQSIYRFRKADIYTYLSARDFIGESSHYLLDTNFRSSKQLIGALNALFAREWLHLPKAGRILPYHPVKAGAKIDTDFSDEKGAIHFLLAEGDSLFEEAFLPYAVREIEKLGLKQCALLVKDRYQAEKASKMFKSRGIAATLRSQTPLGQTEAFQAIAELFDAVFSPHDKNAAHIVMAGPFAKPDLYFPELKRLLEDRGLVPFARELSLEADMMQIFELLFAWEKREGFSIEGLRRYLKTLKTLEPEEGGRQRMEGEEEAVQIMTLHVSKGLEFDVVFALGLASRTPQSDEAEELDAEKMRQLYVAMTRAKKRLYVPIALSKREGEAGTHSPMELFARHFEGSFIEQIETLSKTESISLETLSPPVILTPFVGVKTVERNDPLPMPRPFAPSFLFSFTTLAQTKESNVKWTGSDPDLFTLQTMPRGSDTGIAIHEIFEQLFSSKQPIWRAPSEMDALVLENLRFSPLFPWKEAIQQMVRQTVAMPLQSERKWFSLSEINRFQVEMEFVFSSASNFIKGFIDLLFYHRGKVYFADWKTNWLDSYDAASMQKAMQAHDYGLQATLYKEAIQRHFKAEFGGAFYVFVRGGAYLHING